MFFVLLTILHFLFCIFITDLYNVFEKEKLANLNIVYKQIASSKVFLVSWIEQCILGKGVIQLTPTPKGINKSLHILHLEIF